MTIKTRTIVSVFLSITVLLFLATGCFRTPEPLSQQTQRRLAALKKGADLISEQEMLISQFANQMGGGIDLGLLTVTFADAYASEDDFGQFYKKAIEPLGTLNDIYV